MKRSPLKRTKPLSRSWWRKKTAATSLRVRKPLLRRTPLKAVGQRKRRMMKLYAAYLRSPQWKALRKIVFERDGYRCQRCGVEAGWFKSGSRDVRGLQAHHLHYKSFMHESPADLSTRCIPCHRLEHRGRWWQRIPTHILLRTA